MRKLLKKNHFLSLDLILFKYFYLSPCHIHFIAVSLALLQRQQSRPKHYHNLLSHNHNHLEQPRLLLRQLDLCRCITQIKRYPHRFPKMAKSYAPHLALCGKRTGFGYFLLAGIVFLARFSTAPYYLLENSLLFSLSGSRVSAL